MTAFAAVFRVVALSRCGASLLQEPPVELAAPDSWTAGIDRPSAQLPPGCLAGRRVAFATATEWVARLAEAQRAGRLAEEITRLQRIPLIVVDEVGYIPFDPAAANLIFQLRPARYERASMIVTKQQALLGLGRDLRRRGGRRGDDRSPRAPRRDPLAQRRQLPPARQGHGHPARPALIDEN